MPREPDIDGVPRADDAACGTGALAEAFGLCRGVLARDPLNRDALKQYVALAAKLRRSEDALAALDTASGLEPENAEWSFGRALVLAAAGRDGEAIAAYDRAIASRPDEFAYRLGRAGLLAAAGRLTEALADHDAAIASRPDAIEPRMARGGLLESTRRFDEALAEYDRVIERQSDYAHAWFAKALLLLRLGRYREGWPLYEWRWFVPGVSGQDRLYAWPMWDGAPFAGSTLYIHIEQGLGDSIQFYRFVPMAMRYGRVVLGVSGQLAELLSGQPNAPLVVATGQPLPRIDLHCPLLSLPWLLDVELSTLPAAPYLRADPGLVETWRTRLRRAEVGLAQMGLGHTGQAQPDGAPGRLRVGIVWAGNPRHANDRNRSLPLRTMLDMLVPDVTAVSLQVNVADGDRDTLRQAGQTLDLSQHLTNLAETAAAISQLDLVISVDTAVAHLAGALGKPVWILLPATADWRWLLDREDSPWYRSARLFRQDKDGDWNGVADRVRGALRELIGSP